VNLDATYYLLHAEAVAWPLASEGSFRTGLSSFRQNPVGIVEGATGTLAEEMEDLLRVSARGLSLDTLRQIRNLAWFDCDAPERAQQLHDYTIRLASRHLEVRGASVELRVSGSLAEAALRWRWLSFALSPDLLIAAVCAQSDVLPIADHVAMSPPILREKLLQNPAAETHMHVGAGISFPMLWTSLAASIGTVEPADAARGGSTPFGSGDAFVKRLLHAFIVRLIIAGFLRRRLLGATGDFESHLKHCLPIIARRMSWESGAGDAMRALLTCIRSVSIPKPPASLAMLRLIYRRLAGQHFRHDTDDAPDPLSGWLAASGSSFPETRLLTLGIQYLASRAADPSFARLFWQYVRIRNLTYRHLVERPGTAGLDWFGRHYHRISPLRKRLEDRLYRSALEVQSEGINLGALEARTSPMSSWHEQKEHVQDIARQARGFAIAARNHGQAPPEIGLVLHFIKEHARSGKNKRRLHGDPRSYTFGCRYGEWFHARRREVTSIRQMLAAYPHYLVLLRGIDVANVELAIPTWVVLPLIAEVGEISSRAASRVQQWRPDLGVRPMRTTLHIGEDYRRLAEGIRRMHEAVEYGALRPGDRIGHGIAIADDVDRWVQRTGAVLAQPAEERLDDLLWELELYGRDVGFDGSRAESVRREALQLANAIYGTTSYSIDQLVMARNLRHKPAILRQLGYPFMRESPFRAAQAEMTTEILIRYLVDSDVFVRGQVPVEVTATAGEIGFLKNVQRWLRRELAAREITIESNPSSNLLIGELGDLSHHPAMRLQPLGPCDDHRVLLSINTDNPLTFASRLADEFAHVYFAMLRSGVSASDALAWLDARRADGWSSRFTLHSSTRESLLEAIAGTS
jgi:hypothetical protein